MKIEEMITDAAVNLSPHKHPFLNPYHGCPMGCPFCFWLSEEGWENRIQVKVNIVEVLNQYLKETGGRELLYLGSVCDPFMEMEQEYGLTRRCLEVIKDYAVPLLITTSAVSDVILQELDLLKSMVQRVIIVVELSRIHEVEEMNKGGSHKGIEHANVLKAAGMEVWTTLSPILPGITDLSKVLVQLNDDIPVYIDRLSCTSKEIQGQRVMEWIRRDYPEFEDQYEKIIDLQDFTYFEKLLSEYEGDNRVKTFPFQLGE